jgi:hypothetical protein
MKNILITGAARNIEDSLIENSVIFLFGTGGISENYCLYLKITQQCQKKEVL